MKLCRSCRNSCLVGEKIQCAYGITPGRTEHICQGKSVIVNGPVAKAGRERCPYYAKEAQ